MMNKSWLLSRLKWKAHFFKECRYMAYSKYQFKSMAFSIQKTPLNKSYIFTTMIKRLNCHLRNNHLPSVPVPKYCFPPNPTNTQPPFDFQNFKPMNTLLIDDHFCAREGVAGYSVAVQGG
jgi:hypothetical protein